MNNPFLDKWGLPALAVIIGGIILWGLIFAKGREPDGPSNVPKSAAAKP